MHEYVVTLQNGSFRFFADCYLRLGGVYQFYLGDVICKEIPASRVVNVKIVWTVGGGTSK